MSTCPVEFVPQRGELLLTCNRPAGRHLIHHDPRTGVRYMRTGRGVWDLCGLFRHRPDCPLRTH